MVTRRTILKSSIALGVGGVAGTFSSGTVGASNHDSFVETAGTEFVVDGESFYFNGTNNFYVTDDFATEADVDDALSLFSDLGINVLRTWAHCDGKDTNGMCLQPEPGVHSEEALQHLDYVVAAAAEHDIRLILAMVDNWEHEGGMLQYAQWTGGNSREHFYTNQQARDLFRNHVETIVTRQNTITGVEYRDDPTIMMWELANEPRLEADDRENGGEFDRAAGEHRDILGDWIADMSAYIKSLDSNHLVSTGSEGHYFGTFDDQYPYGNWGGQDYVGHHQIDTIDACSFHWYPDHWNMDLSHGSTWIQEHVQDAHQQVGKPAYLGEFNVNVDNGLQTRNQYLEEWYDTFDQNDGNAILIWQVVLDRRNDHDGFQIYRDESGYIIEAYAQVAAEKSGSGTGGCDGIEVGSYCATDPNGDGKYTDVNGNGGNDFDDVVSFFDEMNSDGVQNNVSAFDFNDNGGIDFDDVVALFESV